MIETYYVITYGFSSLQRREKSFKLKNKKLQKHMETYETLMKLMNDILMYMKTKYSDTKIFLEKSEGKKKEKNETIKK